MVHNRFMAAQWHDRPEGGGHIQPKFPVYGINIQFILLITLVISR